MAKYRLLKAIPHTLSLMLKEITEYYGSWPAVSYVGEEPLTYEDFKNKAGSVARWLDDRGVKPGERVALYGANGPEWGYHYFGIVASGRVVVPVLPDFSGEEAVKILAHAEARAVFITENQERKLKGQDLGSVIARRMDSDDLDEPLDSWIDVTVDSQQTAAIIYTSGTTGTPKGVMLSHRNLTADIKSSLPVAQFKGKDHLLSILPMAHAYEGTVGFLTPLAGGAHIHYTRRPPAPSVLMPALKRVKPQIMLTVPLIIDKVYRKSILPKMEKNGFMKFLFHCPGTSWILHRLAGGALKRNFGGKIRFFGVGGAPLPKETEKFLRKAKFPYAMGYGLTETSPLVAGAIPGTSRFTSTGKIIEDVEVRIMGEDGVLPNDGKAEGEVQIKGPNVMTGYYKNEEITKSVFTEDGWFKTGDLGALDKKGNLFIRGRVKNMILGPNGENIYPEAIESIINDHDFVEESLVYWDEEEGLVARIHLDRDSVKASLKELASEAEDAVKSVGEYLKDLQGKVNKQLSRFSRIKLVIDQKEPFEKTPTHKIKRFKYTGQQDKKKKKKKKS